MSIFILNTWKAGFLAASLLFPFLMVFGARTPLWFGSRLE